MSAFCQYKYISLHNVTKVSPKNFYKKRRKIVDKENCMNEKVLAYFKTIANQKINMKCTLSIKIEYGSLYHYKLSWQDLPREGRHHSNDLWHQGQGQAMKHPHEKYAAKVSAFSAAFFLTLRKCGSAGRFCQTIQEWPRRGGVKLWNVPAALILGKKQDWRSSTGTLDIKTAKVWGGNNRIIGQQIHASWGTVQTRVIHKKIVNDPTREIMHRLFCSEIRTGGAGSIWSRRRITTSGAWEEGNEKRRNVINWGRR